MFKCQITIAETIREVNPEVYQQLLASGELEEITWAYQERLNQECSQAAWEAGQGDFGALEQTQRMQQAARQMEELVMQEILEEVILIYRPE